MNRRAPGFLVAISLLLGAPLFAAPSVNIAVFVPGVAAGSPIYEQMISGAQKAAAEFPHLQLKVVEGGFNQADWPERVTSLAATGSYDYILTSNPSLPSICAEVGKSFPKQKFICVDGYLPGNPQIYTLMYDQVEQGYLAGYLAGLVTKSTMKGATPELKVGVIVAQEYPALTREILPGYRLGCAAADRAHQRRLPGDRQLVRCRQGSGPRQQHDGRRCRRHPLDCRWSGAGGHQGGAAARPLRGVLRQQRIHALRRERSSGARPWRRSAPCTRRCRRRCRGRSPGERPTSWM